MGRIETVWMRFDEPLFAAAPDQGAAAETPTESDAGAEAGTDAAEAPAPSIWHVVGGDTMIRTWIDLAPTTGENILVGIVGGEAAGEFAELDDQKALAAAIASLAPFRASAG